MPGRTLRAALCAACIMTACAGPAAADERHGAEGGERREIVQMRNIRMPGPDRLDPGGMITDQRRIPPPRRYGDGREIRAREYRVPPAGHAEVTGDRELMRSITREQSAERIRNRHYWHDYRGRRYSHFYDDRGAHWYGFYHGPSFYWTRYYGGRWWWYDRRYSRWDFWWNGYWWWQGPRGPAFIYIHDGYYPYEEGGVLVKKSTEMAAPASPPPPERGKRTVSPDKRRMVQIAGPSDEAFLYDESGGKPVYMRFLGKNAEKATFTGGTAGEPLRILLDFKDHSFALYDADGNAVRPSQPGSEPPPPVSPPGTEPGTDNGGEEPPAGGGPLK